MLFQTRTGPFPPVPGEVCGIIMHVMLHAGFGPSKGELLADWIQVSVCSARMGSAVSGVQPTRILSARTGIRHFLPDPPKAPIVFVSFFFLALQMSFLLSNAGQLFVGFVPDNCIMQAK